MVYIHLAVTMEDLCYLDIGKQYQGHLLDQAYSCLVVLDSD